MHLIDDFAKKSGQTYYLEMMGNLSGDRLIWIIRVDRHPGGAFYPPNLILLEATIIGFCGLLLFIARDHSRGFDDPIFLWALGMVACVVGLLLLIAPAPRFVTNDLAIAFVLAAMGNTWQAARQFAGRGLNPLGALAGASVWLVACRIPALQSQSSQMTASWAIGSAYSFATAAALWPDGKEKLPARPAMLILLIMHGALYAARSMIAASGWDETFRTTFSSALIIEGQIRVIGMAFLAVAMTKQRAECIIKARLQSAQQAVEARRQFLTQMSHEVRTSLNGVLGLAQLLGRDTRLLADQCQHVEALEAAGRHLLAIVNDALDLARIDAGRMDFVGRPFDLEKAADECLALVRPAATDKQIVLGIGHDEALPQVVVGDRMRLQQILLNLLWNALKFTPTGGTVTLRVEPAAQGIGFEIIDTGPGIPAERRHLLFQDFTQFDPSASEGSGLGLAISARMARQMGGRLDFRPALGVTGSVFRLELPWPAAILPAESRIEPMVLVPVAQLDLLVIDDVRVNRRLLNSMLSAEGHTVSEAEGGVEALAMVIRQRFDAILLDLHMPDMDGFAAANRIRTLPNGQGMPIFAVSADAMPETIAACLAAGMAAVISKPIDRRLLLDTLTRFAVGLRRPYDVRGVRQCEEHSGKATPVSLRVT